MPAQLTVFHINFSADLASAQGRQIAAAARVRLRPMAIDNEWKDTVGRGDVGDIDISLSRTNTPGLWQIVAMTPYEPYDRPAAEQLRADILAALREHADDYHEYPSELCPSE
jgi:hypothetical protein